MTKDRKSLKQYRENMLKKAREYREKQDHRNAETCEIEAKIAGWKIAEL